jgi:hypothetical protein
LLTEIVQLNIGEDSLVDIEFVAYIPREPSGKYRYYKLLNGQVVYEFTGN